MQLVVFEVSYVGLKVIGLQDTETISLVRSIDEALIYSIDEVHADHLRLISEDVWLDCGDFGVGVEFERLCCLHFIRIINKVLAIISFSFCSSSSFE